MRDDFAIKAAAIRRLQCAGAEKSVLGRLRIWNITNDYIISKLVTVLCFLGFCFIIGLVIRAIVP
jgi:hypothetical protein